MLRYIRGNATKRILGGLYTRQTINQRNCSLQAQPLVNVVWVFAGLWSTARHEELACTRSGCSTSNSKMPKKSRVEYTKCVTTASHPQWSLEQLFSLELFASKNKLCVLDARTLPILRWLGVVPSWWWNQFLRVRTGAKTAPEWYGRTRRRTKCIEVKPAGWQPVTVETR